MGRELSYFCMDARWMRLSLLIAVLFITGRWHNTAWFFPQCKKKKKSSLALSHFFEGNIWTGFIYLYSNLTTEMHQLVFRGFLLKKASYPVIRRFKNTHIHNSRKEYMSGKETERLKRHADKENLHWNKGGARNSGSIVGLLLHKPDSHKGKKQGNKKWSSTSSAGVNQHQPFSSPCCNRRPIPKCLSGLRVGSGLSSAVPPNLIHSFRWKDFIDLYSVLRWVCLELQAINWW